jgi:hypothetical protein
VDGRAVLRLAAQQLSADGAQELLDARLVQIRRGEEVTGEAGSAGLSPSINSLTRLDPDGRLPPGRLRAFSSGLALPRQGVVVPLTRAGVELGALVVVPGPDRGVARSVRVALAGVAHTLAATGPAPAKR